MVASLSVLLSCVGLAMTIQEKPALAAGARPDASNTSDTALASAELTATVSGMTGPGATVSGARVSGARVSGARVSGATVPVATGPGMTRFRAGEAITGRTRYYGTDGKRRGTSALRLGVPAYWSAGTVSGAAGFAQLIAAAPTVDTVIVNGSASGPATPYDPALAAVIRQLRDRGVTVLGYVDTGYLGRTGQPTTRINAGSTAIGRWRAQATADANTWFDLYGRAGLGGVFFDQTLSDCGRNNEYLDAYGAISANVWRRDSEAVVAINPGTSVHECYTRVANLIMIAENTMAGYRSWTPPAWTYSYPREMFWHVVHGAAAGELGEALRLARQRNAGKVFVTNAVLDSTGGPWNTLPAAPYWHKQIAAVRATRFECQQGVRELGARESVPRERHR